jgi:hypothetical protein
MEEEELKVSALSMITKTPLKNTNHLPELREYNILFIIFNRLLKKNYQSKKERKRRRKKEERPRKSRSINNKRNSEQRENKKRSLPKNKKRNKRNKFFDSNMAVVKLLFE